MVHFNRRGGALRLRHPVGAVVLAGCLSVLAACTTAPLPRADSLGDAFAAIYLSPQTYDFVGNGEVALIHPDGSSTSVLTSGMDNGQVTWTDEGLYFADTHNDYLLAESLHSWDSPKPNLQEVALKTADGVLALYNEGDDGSDRGYVDRLVASSPGSSTHTEVTGYQRLVSECGSNLAGVSPISGRDFTRLAEQAGVSAARDDDYPQMLTWLHPARGSAKNAFIAAAHSPDQIYPRGVAPCTDDRVTYLIALVGSGSAGNTVTFQIRQWSTTDGGERQHELRSPLGGSVAVSLDQFGTATIRSELTEDGRLLWYAGDGVVRATDPATGTTTELWNSGLPTDRENSTAVVFRGDYLFLLDVPNDDSSQPLQLRRHEALTGRGGAIVDVPGINARRNLHRVLRGFDVAPALYQSVP